MKAAVFHGPGDIECRPDIAKPSPAAGEVLVHVAACGICGSDLHVWRSASNVTRQIHAATLHADAAGRCIIGHEYAGVIIELGAGVQDYRVGDAVVGVTAGGGMAEYVVVPVGSYQLARIPAGVSFEAAATTEPLADALQLVRKAQLVPHENVVVIGLGLLGLSVLQVLRTTQPHLGKIVAVDVLPSRLEMAATLGASEVVNAARENVVARVGEICGVVPQVYPPMCPPDVAVVIDCAGYTGRTAVPAPLQTALDLLHPQGGRIVCIGVFEDGLALDLMDLVNKQATIIGSLGYEPEDLMQALALMANRAVDRDRLISHRYTLDRVRDAFAMQDSSEAIKVMVLPNESDEVEGMGRYADNAPRIEHHIAETRPAQSVRLRAARETDLPAIFAIYDEQVLHGTATFDTVPKTEAERLDWFRINPGGRYPIVVAEGDSGVLGWGRLYQWSPRPAYDRTAENAVYVRLDTRGRGIGRLILEELLRLAPQSGVLTLIARIVAGNPASLALHEALGYTRIGLMERCGIKHGQVLDVWMLQRVLDAPR